MNLPTFEFGKSYYQYLPKSFCCAGGYRELIFGSVEAEQLKTKVKYKYLFHNPVTRKTIELKPEEAKVLKSKEHVILMNALP